MFGSHLSIAQGLDQAALEAHRLGMQTVQVFTKNQQQWAAKPLDPEVVRRWRDAIAELGWQGRTVSHASYLINLASPDDALWNKSVDLMTDEIRRCDALGIAFLVHHPGSYTGWTLEEGLARIADAYKQLFERTKGARVVSCLEGTVGAGRLIGGRFEELASLRERIIAATGQAERVGFCLDTCHMHAAGYDLSDAARAREHLRTFDQVAGLTHVRVLHINDSKAPAGSKRDLHEHIGEGTIAGGSPGKPSRRLSACGFGAFLNHPLLRDVPKILETPKGLAPAKGDKPGEPWDAVNLRRLRRLLEDKGPDKVPDKGEGQGQGHGKDKPDDEGD